MLIDHFSRKFEYLRLSITDSCNFKCQYCLPNGFKPTFKTPYLTVSEIVKLVTCFSELGLWKIRLTGGEPTLRRDFEKIAAHIAAINGIKKLVFSTNGFRLAKFAKSFYDSGLRGVNISLDSLDRKKFYEMTGQDKLNDILEGIDIAQDVGFESIKINAVLLKDFNDQSLNEFIEFIQHRKISVRFIELMQTSQNNSFFKKHHLSASHIISHLQKLGFHKKPRQQAAGPAEEWGHPEFQGNIGIIAPYSKDFCTTCNRLRISSIGLLRLCLFGTGGLHLREYLQSDDQKEDLKQAILNALRQKGAAHDLNQGNFGDTQNLASIGG